MSEWNDNRRDQISACRPVRGADAVDEWIAGYNQHVRERHLDPIREPNRGGHYSTGWHAAAHLYADA